MNHSNISGFSSGRVTVCSRPSVNVPLRAAAKNGELVVSNSLCMENLTWASELPTMIVARECMSLKLDLRVERVDGKRFLGEPRPRACGIVAMATSSHDEVELLNSDMTVQGSVLSSRIDRVMDLFARSCVCGAGRPGKGSSIH